MMITKQTLTRPRGSSGRWNPGVQGVAHLRNTWCVLLTDAISANRNTND